MSVITINDLPDEILEYIFYFLPPYDDIFNCMIVCKKWHEVAKNVIPRIQQKFSEAISLQNVTWEVYRSEGDNITKRYAHSSCRHKNSMYIFGGFTSSFSSFNDLWKLNLSTKSWIRIYGQGKCPVPKAGATMASYKNKLILFGGMLPQAQRPIFQVRRMSNHLHIYDILKNQWEEINCNPLDFELPGLAGHTATIHRDKLVVFGGLGERASMNDVYTLDLLNNTWKLEVVDCEKPSERYGHSQLYINEDHLMIMGGISSEVVASDDVWLLNMSSEKWNWRKVDLGIHAPLIRNIWCHPVCKVGNKIVVFKPITGNPGTYVDWFSVEVSSNTKDNQEVNLNGKRGVLNRLSNADTVSDGNKFKKSFRDPEQIREFLPTLNEFKSPIMELHVLDTSKVLEDGILHYIKSKNRPVYPTDTILYSVIEGNGELIMFGGIQKDTVNFDDGTDEFKNKITDTLRVIKIKRKTL